MKKSVKETIVLESNTYIDLMVNGELVHFSFVGHPTIEYMNSAREAAELIESENEIKAGAKKVIATLKVESDLIPRSPYCAANHKKVKKIIESQNFLIDVINDSLKLIGTHLSIKHNELVCW